VVSVTSGYQYTEVEVKLTVKSDLVIYNRIILGSFIQCFCCFVGFFFSAEEIEVPYYLA